MKKKKKFETSLENLDQKQKLISPKVFDHKSAIEICEYWIKNGLSASWSSSKEIYCKLKKEKKENVHYFLFQCDIYFRERAVRNLIEMNDKTDAKSTMRSMRLFSINSSDE